MTGNSCLLDTSIVIHIFKQNKAIAERLDQLKDIYISSVTVGELYFGAYASNDPDKHKQRIETFLLNCKLISLDNNTADMYGKIKAALKKKGKPIPENDIWIGAIAMQYRLSLYTTDKHFSEIEGLRIL